MIIRLKLWFLRWLGAASMSDVECIRAEDNDFILAEQKREISELKAAQETAMMEVIQELHKLRSSLPVPVTQDVKQPVRTFRNFREFRTVVEGRDPSIRIERKA